MTPDAATSARHNAPSLLALAEAADIDRCCFNARLAREALARFKTEGVPSTRDEAWHYTNLKSLANLDQLVGKMDEAAARGNVDTYLPLNLQFHAALYGLADNQRVAALDQELGNELLVYRRRGLASGGGLAVSNIEHRQILTALAGGNAAELKRLFQRHINGGKQRFLDAIGSGKTPS